MRKKCVVILAIMSFVSSLHAQLPPPNTFPPTPQMVNGSPSPTTPPVGNGQNGNLPRYYPISNLPPPQYPYAQNGSLPAYYPTSNQPPAQNPNESQNPQPQANNQAANPFCPQCSCRPCMCGAMRDGSLPQSHQVPCGPIVPIPCQPLPDPGAPVCGTNCGVTVCAIGAAIALVGAAAAIVIAAGNGNVVH